VDYFAAGARLPKKMAGHVTRTVIIDKHIPKGRTKKSLCRGVAQSGRALKYLAEVLADLATWSGVIFKP